jgi:hypothetical protein
MPQPLQHRRGATLPASLAEGEFFFKTDTQIWYSGPTGGGTPILASPPSKFVFQSGVTYFLGFLNVAYEPGLLDWGIDAQEGQSLDGAGVVTGTGTATLSDFPVSFPAVLVGEDEDGEILQAVVFNGKLVVSFFGGAKTTPLEAALTGVVYFQAP